MWFSICYRTYLIYNQNQCCAVQRFLLCYNILHAPHATRRRRPACLVKPIFWHQHHGCPPGSMQAKTTRAIGESCSSVQAATISPVTNS